MCTLVKSVYAVWGVRGAIQTKSLLILMVVGITLQARGCYGGDLCGDGVRGETEQVCVALVQTQTLRCASC